MTLVEKYSRILDPELCYTKGHAVEVFSVQRQRSIDMGDLDVVAAGCVPEDEDGTEGVVGSKAEKGEHSPRAKLPGITEDSRSDDGSDELPGAASNLPNADESSSGPSAWEEAFLPKREDSGMTAPLPEPSAFAEARVDSAGRPQAATKISDSDSEEDAAYEKYMESLKQAEEIPVVEETEDVVIPKAGFTPRSDYEHHASGKSCLALRALIKSALLENALPAEGKTGEKEKDSTDVCIQWCVFAERVRRGDVGG